MPNAVQEGIYQQYYNNVIKMAQEKGGVSRPQLMHALSISRTVADQLIGRCKLRHGKTDGKTEYFYVSRGSEKVAKAAVGATTTETAIAEAPPKSGKGKNRLPQDDEPTPAAPEAPTAPAVAPTVLAPPVDEKPVQVLDQEIMAIQQAMGGAVLKSEGAHKTYLVQKAHAEGLGAKLGAAIAANQAPEAEALQQAIGESSKKSEAAFKTYLAQKAHAEALGTRLSTVLAQRLARG